MSGEPIVARLLTVGGAHVVVSGTVAGSDLALRCEGCGKYQGPFLAGEWGEAQALADVQRHARRHAEACRHVPKRLWPTGPGEVAQAE